MTPPITVPSSAPVSRSALWLAFATIYLVWGSTYLAIRVAVETLPPFLMAGARFLVAGSLLYGWLWLTRKIRPTPRQWVDNAIVGALLLLIGNGLVSWAEQTIPSGIATLLISIGPLFIVLGDWLVLTVGRDATRGARPTAATLAGIVLGVGGLVLDEPIGPRLLIASAIIIAGVAIITAQKNRTQLAVTPRQAVAATEPARRDAG